MCRCEREDWLIQLAIVGGVAEEVIRVLLVEGGRVQKEPGMIGPLQLLLQI